MKSTSITIREQEEEEKTGLFSMKDFDEHGYGSSSSLDILAKAACFIAGQKTMEENLVPPKKGFSNFNFLNDTSAGPSNMSTTPQEENRLVIRGEEEVSHCPIQQVTNLLEECCQIQKYPKKTRSSCKSITIFGQKLSYAQKKRASFSNNMFLGLNSNSNLNLKKDKEKKKRVVVTAKNTGKKVKFDNDMPPPDLPEEFESLIGKMKGTNVQRLVHKSLTQSDINGQQCRLLLPRQQTISTTFLEPHEKNMLRNYGSLTVPILIGPKLEQQEINLGLWNPKKGKEFYVLKSHWKRVVNDHGLDEGDVVELWSFRVNHNNNEINGSYDNEGQLHFALVLGGRRDAIKKEGGKEGTISSANGGSSSVSNNLMDVQYLL